MANQPAKKTVTLQLNLQQLQVLGEVRKQGTMGRTEGEVIRRAFLNWYRQKQKESTRARTRKSQRSR